MELVLPLLAGLLAVVGIVVGWRWWSRRQAERTGADSRPALAALPAWPEQTSPETVAADDLVARMRDRPLGELGIGRALPRTARTVGICQRCGRTLDRGRRRCAGCGAWLVDGIPVRRAGAFVARGVAIGVIVGLFAGLMLASLAADDPAAVAPATNGLEESVGPAPSGVRAALDAMLAVGSRLVAARDGLAAALAEPAPDAASVAGQLRAVDAEAAEGIALSATLDRWPGSRDLAAELRSFHVAVREAATPGIRGDAPAARAAGSAVIESLRALGTLNARTIEMAREVGVLPPASVPATSPAAPPSPAASPVAS